MATVSSLRRGGITAMASVMIALALATGAAGATTVSSTGKGSAAADGGVSGDIRTQESPDGLVMTPEDGGHRGLVIISHLRAPGCSDGSFADPCPPDTQARRFDTGMAYLGEDLARQGFGVIIPQLAQTWASPSFTEPFDQLEQWRTIVARLTETARAAGTHTDRVGIVEHSRSAAVTDSARELFPQAQMSVVAYGPSYATFAGQPISPVGEDVAYLAVVGDEDQDVGTSAQLWLSEHLMAVRSQPAAAVLVPGFGHMLVNRTLSEAGVDDRIGCEDGQCPDAAAHEALLATAVSGWFDQTLADPHQPVADSAPIAPTTPTDALPATFAGYPARWLAATPGTDVVHVPAKNFGVTTCRHGDPMNPMTMADACAEPATGVVNSLAQVAQMTHATANVTATGVRVIAVHGNPLGAPTPSELAVTVQFTDGRQWNTTVPGDDPLIADQASARSNGVYVPTTARLVVPDEFATATVSSVTVASPQTFELVGVDLSR